MRIHLALYSIMVGCAIGGCATPEIVTQHVLTPIPAALLSPCPKSELQGKTYQDAIALAISRGKDIDECNKRFEDIGRYVSPAP